MNPEQLWETTMDPATASWCRSPSRTPREADRVVTILMGDKVEPRREYFSEYANFNREDEFENMEVHHGE